MLFSREIEDLHDDGFEGSINELRTSQKLYFGNDGDSRGSKKCFVTGVINFERDYNKDSYVSLCSNSGNSDITNQEDPYNVKEQSYDVNVKRMKLSADELSGAKPYLQKVLNSSAPLNRVVSCGSQPASKCSTSSLDGSEEKDNLLVSSSAVVTIESGSRRVSKPRWKDSCFIELDEAEMSLIKNSPNDPRPVLRYHINRLFKASGWAVGRRKRSNTYNGIGEYVYKSPEGRPIREFRRAWILCGQSLFTDSNNVLQESDGKHWTDLSHFWADLSNTSTEINGLDNSETSTALLAHCWYLLDPFAKAVFIDRTFSCLKGGKVTKAKRSLLMDSSYTNRAVGSSLVSDCALTIFDPDFSSIRQDRCGRGHFVSSEHLHRVPVKVLCEEDYLCSSYKLSGPNFREISSSERSSLDPFSLQDYGSDSSSDPIGNDLFEVPIHTEDENVYGGNPEYFIDNGGSDRILKNSSLCSAQQRNAKKQLRFKKFNHLSGNSEKFVYANNKGKHPGFSVKPKKPRFCGGNASYNDDDLLISAIIKPKSFISTTKGSKRVRCKSKPLRKHKSQRGSCRLLPRSKGGPHHTDGVWSAFGSRTILSWLINSGVISINEGIQYRNKKDDAVVKHGLVTWHGILCRCCDSVLSMSEFKRHAGFRLYHGPCLNLFMESGKPFTLCQLEAWSAEYRARKRVTRTVQVYEMDDSDDSCGLCGGGGELICCDNCPSTFHQACLHLLELPEGSWYCWHCTCQVCGDVVDDKDASNIGVLKCLQCEHKYHKTCVKEKGCLKAGAASDFWLCGESCQQIYSGLHSRVGLMNLISGGLSWTLLRCIHGDKKVHSAQRLVALKAECNIKLAVALTIMEECFLPMVDTRTGMDMIPHVLYNWGSQFARLNYHGFYTVVLEKNDVVMSVASIRIHGATVAEMPLIATCNKYRRQGMCRHLMNAIEEMLRSVKVEKLVISAIPDLVETWTVCFGFKQLDDNERQGLNTVNLMVFPGTVWLKKSFSYNHQVAAEQPVGTDDLAKSRVHSEDHITELARQPEGNFCTEEVDADTEIRGPTDNNIQAVKDQDEDLNDQFLKLSCEGTAANKLELVCHVGTIEVYTDKLLPFTEQPDKFSLL